MIDKILNLLFPPKCPFCQKLLSGKAPICPDCMKELPFTGVHTCSICGRPLGEFSHSVCSDCKSRKIYFEHAFIPLIYKDRARETAIAMKAAHPYYAKAFAYLLADKILSSPYYDFDCVTFVPQNSRSARERGYNQAQLIAKELARLLNLPCKPTLKRSNAGKQQHTLNAQQRRENVKQCYYKTEIKENGTALLVDDIYTTGATSNYCSRLLKEMGFSKVYLAIALIRCDD